MPQRRGKVSKTRKGCHRGVARFPKLGKDATEAWRSFQDWEDDFQMKNIIKTISYEEDSEL